MRTASQRQFSTEIGIHILPLPYSPTIVVIPPLFIFLFFFYLHLPCSCPASVLLLPSFCLLSGRPDVSPWLRIILSKLHPQVLPHSTPAADQDLGESQGEEWAEKKHVPTQSPLMMRSSALSAAGNQSRALVPFLLNCPNTCLLYTSDAADE